MTLDKIKHYLGAELYGSICSMEEAELRTVQQINHTDIADEPKGTERANFLYAEKNLIDYLLGCSNQRA